MYDIKQWKEKVKYKGETIDVWYAQPKDWVESRVVVTAISHEGILWEIERIRKGGRVADCSALLKLRT